jgi:hypothetical protein
MLERLRKLELFARVSDETDEDRAADVFTSLRLFSAKLVLSTAVNATLHYLRPPAAPPAREAHHAAPGHREPPRPHRGPNLAAWVPLLVGSATVATQVRHSLQPSRNTELATRVLSGVVLGLGAAGTAAKLRGAVRGDEPFSFAPLLFGYSGLIHFLLDRQEAEVAMEKAELERRARLVERLVPRRRTRIDRIVVHV